LRKCDGKVRLGARRVQLDGLARIAYGVIQPSAVHLMERHVAAIEEFLGVDLDRVLSFLDGAREAAHVEPGARQIVGAGGTTEEQGHTIVET
jgi:hypothetical protein